MDQPPRTTPPDGSERPDPGFERPDPGFERRPDPPYERPDPGFERPVDDDWRRYGGAEYDLPPPPRRRSRGVDFAAFFILLDALRRAVPRDLEEQFTRLVREALLTLRSLIDWYLERLDRPPREPRVEDIPIE